MSKKVPQKHGGSGDNVAGDRTTASKGRSPRLYSQAIAQAP